MKLTPAEATLWHAENAKQLMLDIVNSHVQIARGIQHDRPGLVQRYQQRLAMVERHARRHMALVVDSEEIEDALWEVATSATRMAGHASADDCLRLVQRTAHLVAAGMDATNYQIEI